MSLRGVIASLATGTYTVTREAAGVYVQGRYVRSTYAAEVTAVDADADTLAIEEHGHATGDGPFWLMGSGLPAGTLAETDYWVIATSADLVQLAASEEAASDDEEEAEPIDLEDVGAGVITLIRPPSTSTLSIVAVEEPVRGRELQDLAEGQHGTEMRLLITETQLRGRTPAGEPDIVTIDGEPWRVERVETCKSFGSVHFEVIVARATRGP